MSKKLLELHQLAAQAKIHQAQYDGGIISTEEYNGRLCALDDHNNISTKEHHKEHADCYRDMINDITKHIIKEI